MVSLYSGRYQDLSKKNWKSGVHKDVIVKMEDELGKFFESVNADSHLTIRYAEGYAEFKLTLGSGTDYLSRYFKKNVVCVDPDKHRRETINRLKREIAERCEKLKKLEGCDDDAEA